MLYGQDMNFCHIVVPLLDVFFPPVVSPGLSVQLGAPAAPHDGDRVPGMVPHRVQTQVGLQPLRHGRGLPLRDPAVEVPGQHDRDLRVQAGQEPPQHREEAGGRPRSHCPRDGLDVAEVEERVGAGLLAEPGEERVGGREVVVESQHEAWLQDIERLDLDTVE